jgi:hypothetical protein
MQKEKITTILQIEKIHDVQDEKKWKPTKNYQKAPTHKGKKVKHCYK